MERYLGDGVYASFDGYQIWLKVDRDYGKHEIALEPSVYKALTDYVRELYNEFSEKRQKEEEDAK